MTPPLTTYRVTCLSTLIYRTEFEIQATSPDEAIVLCQERIDLDDNHVEPVAEKFLETDDETDWEAEPL